MKRKIIAPVLAIAMAAIGAVATQKGSVYADSFTIDDIMSDIQASVKADYDVDLVINNRSYVAYKPDGFFAGIYLDGNSGKELEISSDTEYDETTWELINKRYNDTLKSSSGFDFSHYGAYPDEYIRNGILCRIAGDSMNCADIEGNYFAGNKNTLNQLAAAYENAGYDATYLVFGAPLFDINEEIQESEYDGYSRLYVGLSDGRYIAGGGRGAFYKTSVDGNWIYAPEISGQALASCNTFDTEDLQKAFVGEMCWDEDADEVSEVAYIEEVEEDEKDEDEDEDSPKTPDTGVNTEEMKSVAMKLTFVGVPIALIVGYVAKYIYGRMSKRVKFSKR